MLPLRLFCTGMHSAAAAAAAALQHQLHRGQKLRRRTAPFETSSTKMFHGGYASGSRIISVKVNRSAMAMQFASILADEKVPKSGS